MTLTPLVAAAGGCCFGRPPRHCHFHWRMPPEKPGFNWTSIRKPLASTGVNATLLYLFNSTP